MINFIYEFIDSVYILTYNIYPYTLYIIPFAIIGLFFQKTFYYSAKLSYILWIFYGVYLFSFAFLVVFDLWSFWPALIISVICFFSLPYLILILTIVASILVIVNGLWDIFYSLVILLLIMYILGYTPIFIPYLKSEIFGSKLN